MPEFPSDPQFPGIYPLINPAIVTARALKAAFLATNPNDLDPAEQILVDLASVSCDRAVNKLLTANNLLIWNGE